MLMFSDYAATPTLTKISAPGYDIGAETRMMTGSRKLSTRAAKARKMMISANPDVVTKPLVSWTYCGSSRRHR